MTGKDTTMADVRVASVPNHRNVVPRRVCRLRLASILCAASIVGVSGCAHGPTDNYGQGFGMVALMPAQTQKVWIGPAYQLLRVCIDLQTTGSALITIDDRQPKTLRPGLCTE